MTSPFSMPNRDHHVYGMIQQLKDAYDKHLNFLTTSSNFIKIALDLTTISKECTVTSCILMKNLSKKYIMELQEVEQKKKELVEYEKKVMHLLERILSVTAPPAISQAVEHRGLAEEENENIQDTHGYSISNVHSLANASAFASQAPEPSLHSDDMERGLEFEVNQALPDTTQETVDSYSREATPPTISQVVKQESIEVIDLEEEENENIQDTHADGSANVQSLSDASAFATQTPEPSLHSDDMERGLEFEVSQALPDTTQETVDKVAESSPEQRKVKNNTQSNSLQLIPSISASTSEDLACLYCQQLRSQSTEEWVPCVSCGRWANISCTKAEGYYSNGLHKCAHCVKNKVAESSPKQRKLKRKAKSNHSQIPPSISANTSEDFECLYCQLPHSQSTEEWVPCVSCGRWADISCAEREGCYSQGLHTCAYCKEGNQSKRGPGPIISAQVKLTKKGKKRSKTYCHQCRQSRHTVQIAFCTVNRCLLKYCGPCLRTRYKENIKEAMTNQEWHCPKCRLICNCSYCRKKWDIPNNSLFTCEAQRQHEKEKKAGKPKKKMATGKKKNPNVSVDLASLPKMCHQCFQFTFTKMKWFCKNKGCTANFYCQKCLLSVYGENMEEIKKTKKWNCPRCRNGCTCRNCSSPTLTPELHVNGSHHLDKQADFQNSANSEAKSMISENINTSHTQSISPTNLQKLNEVDSRPDKDQMPIV